VIGNYSLTCQPIDYSYSPEVTVLFTVSYSRHRHYLSNAYNIIRSLFSVKSVSIEYPPSKFLEVCINLNLCDDEILFTMFTLNGI
jgi:hypothetical protein